VYQAGGRALRRSLEVVDQARGLQQETTQKKLMPFVLKMAQKLALTGLFVPSSLDSGWLTTYQAGGRALRGSMEVADQPRGLQQLNLKRSNQ